MAKKETSGRKVVADNRKARFNFQIGETFEAGIQLAGTEVKSLRLSRATIAESYVSPEHGEIFLINANIPVYVQASRFNHDPKRPRKLLLNKREIGKLMGAVEREGMTIVPLQTLFQRTRHGEDRDRARARQEAARQARDGEEARLGAGEGPVDAGEGVTSPLQIKLSPPPKPHLHSHLAALHTRVRGAPEASREGRAVRGRSSFSELESDPVDADTPPDRH